MSDDAPDDRPPICPACGVTMGIVVEGRTTRHVCLECGFEDDLPAGRRAAGAGKDDDGGRRSW